MQILRFKIQFSLGADFQIIFCRGEVDMNNDYCIKNYVKMFFFLKLSIIQQLLMRKLIEKDDWRFISFLVFSYQKHSSRRRKNFSCFPSIFHFQNHHSLNCDGCFKLFKWVKVDGRVWGRLLVEDGKKQVKSKSFNEDCAWLKKVI